MKNLLLSFLFCSFFLPSFAQNYPDSMKTIAFDRAKEDYYGSTVSVDGNYAVIGAHRNDYDGNGRNRIRDAGSVYMYERDANGDWNYLQKILPADRSAGANFGRSVCLRGDKLIVGAFRRDHVDANGTFIRTAGAAYIFERDNTGAWNQTGQLIASDVFGFDWFGYSVSISGDYAIVGAYEEDEDPTGANAVSSAGSAYFFEKNANGEWVEVQKVVASNRNFLHYFGWSVSISGEYAVVGSPNDNKDELDMNPFIQTGAAYLYKRNSMGVWTAIQKVVANDRMDYDEFGHSVSISGDNLIVGAQRQNADENGTNTLPDAGAAYIYQRDQNDTWNLSQKIVGSDRDGNDFFGTSVDINGDLLAVGASGKAFEVSAANYIDLVGAVYVFEKDGNGTWNELEKLLAEDKNERDFFGYSVAASSSTVITGSPFDPRNLSGGDSLAAAGSAYFFDQCKVKSGSIMPTACDSYTSPSGLFTWTSSGMYQDTLQSSLGCDSILTINLTITAVDTGISQNWSTLSAAASGATYQWLDCANGYSPIASETSQDFTPGTNGNYAVEVTQNGCVDTTACISIMNVGIGQNDFGPELLFYPNPSQGSMNIELGESYQEIHVRVRNIRGELLMEKHFNHSNRLEFSLDEPSGIYFMEIHTKEGKSASLKFIKR